MLDEKRINDAKNNIPIYLQDNLLKRIKLIDNNVLKILINNCKESLNVANFLEQQNISNLWVIVTSYYSMYYIAKAVLYKKGYKIEEKISHKVTSDALIVYVKSELKENFIEDYENAKEEALEIAGNTANEIIELFDLEREKRARFQYSMTEIAIQSKARTSLDRAKRFVFELEKLL